MTPMRRAAGAGFAALAASAALQAGAIAAAARTDAADTKLVGRAGFADRRDPPAWRELPAAERERFDLGLLVFNTPWVPAGRAGAQRRDGLGPLYLASSCDSCHNNGARGRGTDRPDALPGSFLVQLAGRGIKGYGHVFATLALPGIDPEGSLVVERVPVPGRYADGDGWTLLEPHYRLQDLGYGPLPTDTVLRPRIGPAVFGTGLIEAVLQQAILAARHSQPRRLRGEAGGRLNWSGDAASIDEQTARAFAREMGITSEREPADDCTPRQWACRAAPHGGIPEVSREFFEAVVAFQRNLAVPARPAPLDPGLESRGSALFAQAGCAGCHLPGLPVDIPGEPGGARIDAYTDLLRHDMGDALADRRLSGRPVKSLWRTAPLWGLAHARGGGDMALLHDGRARTIEEAILWHGGQAAASREAFIRMPRAQRADLLSWLETL